MRIQKRLATSLMACVALWSAHSAAAQQRSHYANDLGRFDLAVGLTFNTPRNVNHRPQCDELQVACKNDGWFFDFGLAVQGAMHLSPRVSLLLDASSYNNRWTQATYDTPKVNHVSAVLGGVRFAQPILRNFNMPRVTAFAHALVGPEYSMVLPTRIAFEPGVGVDWRVTPLATMRLSFDRRITQGGPRNLSANQMLFGVVLGHIE